MSAKIEKPRALFALLVAEEGEVKMQALFNDYESAERNGRALNKRYSVRRVFV
jgi:hypothetical protein